MNEDTFKLILSFFENLLFIVNMPYYEFEILLEELENTEAVATTTSYTSYMLNVSQRGGVENVVEAVLACAWSYNFIGKELAKWSGVLDHEFYGHWVKMYSSDEFTELAEDCKQLMNEIATENLNGN